MCACPSDGYLLQNPGFDDFGPGTSLPVPYGWEANHAGTVVPPTDDSEIYLGHGSIVLKANADEVAGIYQIVPAIAGCSYSLEFYAKRPTGGGTTRTVFAEVGFMTDTDLVSHDMFIKGQSLSPDSWTSYRLQTPPAPPGTAQVGVHLGATGTGTLAVIDEASLTVIGCGISG